MTIPQDPIPQEESREELLRQAKRLAEEAARAEAAGPGTPRAFIVFSLGEETLAVELSRIRKVLRPAPLARVPGASPEVLGLMSDNGEILAVLDLRRILGGVGGGGPAPAEPQVLVVHFGDKEAGILVDTTCDVWEVPAPEVRPPLPSLEPSRARFFEGTLARDGRFVGVLNVPVCLNP